MVTVVVVAAAKFRVFCTGRGLCSDRLPGAVERSLLSSLITGRRFGPAVVVVPVVVVVVAVFLVFIVVIVVVPVVVVGVVTVDAVSVLATGDAVVAATRTVGCLVGWSFAKCSFTVRSGSCPLPVKEHSAQPHSALAAGWKCFKCFTRLLCSLYLPLPCMRAVDSPA